MTPFRTLGSGLAGWLLCAAVTAAADLVALDPGEWVPGEATPPARFRTRRRSSPAPPL